ncbi:hypothetical protein CDO25_15845 [Sinorhizobium meliloti]|nr:hypothetical protein CDO25_15845 [Sinorhizobium meliloti]
MDGVRVEFLTQPSSGMLTIKGMDKELAQVIPPSEKPRGLPAMVRDQISPSRSIKLEELDHAATAFAAFVRNQLAAGAS